MRPHRIAVAVYDGVLGFEYGIAAEVLGLRREGLAVGWYDFRPCRVEPGRLTTSHGLRIDPAGDLDDLATADTVLVPGWRLPHDRPPEPLLEALRRADRCGARMVAICTGAFALAYAGVLNGRRATTHWLHVDKLQRQFPAVRVEPDALYLHDGRICTSAGSAAGLDLCLSIVREDFGIAVANTVARRMVAPVHRDGGQSQYVEPTTPVPDDDRFAAVLDRMVAQLDEPVSVGAIARESGFTLRTFQRRFRAVTGLPPHRWLTQQRVARARELLESSDLSVEHVATCSGLGSAANLRKQLALHLGTTPRAYRSAFRARD